MHNPIKKFYLEAAPDMTGSETLVVILVFRLIEENIFCNCILDIFC